jgi:hypothetical protein
LDGPANETDDSRLQRAKTQGKRLGRPKGELPVDHLGVSRATINHDRVEKARRPLTDANRRFLLRSDLRSVPFYPFACHRQHTFPTRLARFFRRPFVRSPLRMHRFAALACELVLPLF